MPTTFLGEPAYDFMRRQLSAAPAGSKLTTIVYEAPGVWHEPEYEGEQFMTAVALATPSVNPRPIQIRGMAANGRLPLYAVNITRFKDAALQD